MKVRKNQLFILLIAAVMFWIQNTYHAQAVDELFLTGIVKDINHKSRLVTVDVKSESCHGTKIFMFDNTSKPDSTLIGKEIFFSINSSICKADTIHKMILPKE